MKADFKMIGLFLLPLALVLFMGVNRIPPPFSLDTKASDGQTLGAKTKSSGCVINNNLPDRECTPGAVDREMSRTQICQTGYSGEDPQVSADVKDAVFQRYNFRPNIFSNYQINRLISLSLGGTDEINNLWP